ncbi:MAG: GAF domain-containing protein [Chloroflexi bacterium]|nr:GAF domain-containing protein [Chloroflexota bacterium]
MNEKTLLDQKQKELDLILAIDHIRDTVVEPSAMLSAIANVLTDQFQADLCLLCLADRETGTLELKAVNDRSEPFGQLEPFITRELAQKVVKADDIVIWKGDQVLPESALAQLPDNLHLAAVPIVLEDKRLGAVLLVRSLASFDSDDVALLKIAESQIDSAVMQGYAYYDLQQRNKELETIYRIDRIRDQHFSFDEMLNKVLQELRAVIQAEMGFVMLYNKTGQRLELRATTNDDLFRVSPHYETVNQIANKALQQVEMVCYDNLGDVIHSVLCIPLILNNEIIGVLGVVNGYGPRHFRSEDRRLLNAIGSQMDTAIFESLERRRLRRVLGRSVDPRVMERLLDNPDVDFLEGERSIISVLYADIRGSTTLAEHTDPELLVGFINDYLGQMTDVILSHEGTLDKFVGDEVMALFSAPFPQPDHALRAVQVGLEMQTTHQAVMETWQAYGVEAAPIGVGIATGELTVGEMGCARRTDYTVIGRAANLGSRICGAATAGQVLISQATYDLITGQIEAAPVAGLQLKGVEHDVTAYHVTRIL